MDYFIVVLPNGSHTTKLFLHSSQNLTFKFRSRSATTGCFGVAFGDTAPRKQPLWGEKEQNERPSHFKGNQCDLSQFLEDFSRSCLFAPSRFMLRIRPGSALSPASPASGSVQAGTRLLYLPEHVTLCCSPLSGLLSGKPATDTAAED